MMFAFNFLIDYFELDKTSAFFNSTNLSNQAIVLQFILELAKSLKIDPRGCFRQFFAKFAANDNPDYHQAFNDELKSFRGTF